MKLKKNIAISETGFIFNPANGDSFSVNSTGARILGLIRENKSAQEMLEVLCSEYDSEKRIIEKDIDDFISLLAIHNLLEQ